MTRRDHEPIDGADGLLAEDGLAAWSGLLRVHARVTRQLDAALAASHGLTLTEYEVLLRISLADGRIRMSELANAAMLSRSAVTRLADELEDLGLIERTADDRDGRAMIAVLTEAGAERFADARRAHTERVRNLFLGPLSAARRAELVAMWAEIEATLPEHESAPRSSRGIRRRRRRARRD